MLGSFPSCLARMVAGAEELWLCSRVCDRLISYNDWGPIVANESQPCDEVASKLMLRTLIKVGVFYR